MSGFSLVQNREETCIGLTKQDLEKYKPMLDTKYNVKLKQIDDKYIGGCIIENEAQGVFIDNTLLNKIEEKLKG